MKIKSLLQTDCKSIQIKRKKDKLLVRTWENSQTSHFIRVTVTSRMCVSARMN